MSCATSDRLPAVTPNLPRGRSRVACTLARKVLEDKANLALLQRLMTAPTLSSHVAKGRAEVTRWARLHYQSHADSPPLSCRKEDIKEDLKPDQEMPRQGDKAAALQDGGDVAGGGDWWCVKAAGGNGGMDIWVLHEGNWRAVTQKLRDGESYVIQVCRGEERMYLYYAWP